MTKEQLTEEISKLKKLAESVVSLKEIKTLDKEAISNIALVIKSIIAEINNIKAEFKDTTGEEAKALAVEVLFDYIDPILKNKLGGVGRFIYKILPEKSKKALIGSIIDLIYNTIKQQIIKIKK